MAGTFIVRGLGFTFPFLPYHLTRLDLPTSSVGALLATFGSGWLAGSVACGWLADRLGRRNTLIGTLLLGAAALPLLAQVRATPALFAATFVAGAVYDGSRPVFTAVIADAFPDDDVRASVNAWRNFTVNVGAAVAGTVGGALAAPIGIPALIWINAAACGGFALVAWRFIHYREPAAAAGPPRVAAALADRSLWWLIAASLAALTCTASLFSALPMLMERDGLSAADYGWAQAANAGAVLALSPLLNRWLANRAARPAPMTGILALSSFLLAVGVGASGFVSTTLGYSATAALAVPGEIFAFVAAADILHRISPPAAQGTYAGIWGTTLAGAVIVAPLLATWALTHGGNAVVGAATFAAGLLGTALCWPLARAVRHTTRLGPNHVKEPTP
ncbi:MFS transporter (plasmid) [Streptomyces sp. NBC_00637]|uniref:MFS transporter n=1 Tax=Streptomyces sp. NBC_00637 TaxID=2903667 RepID=UPI00324909E7